LLGAAIVCVAALLGGCPIYSTTSDYPACGANGPCFDCPSGGTPSDGTCIPWQCSSSGDCPPGYACSASTCVAAADAGDCSGGCPSNFICKLAGGVAQCVPASGFTSDAGSASTDSGQSADATAPPVEAGRADGGSIAATDGSADAPDVSSPPGVVDVANGVDSSAASDVTIGSDAVASDASDAPLTSDASDGSPPASCNANADCGGAAKCINGQCTPQSRLCSDTTQCVVSDESCVDGVCEPHCGLTAPCPGGYSCDFTRGVCNVNSGPCAGSGASTCQGGSTCVEGHCVPPCAAGDAGTACPSGQLCVNGGCIPDEGARFDCKNDGRRGELATVCAATAICLHHDCYAGCDPDAGASACSDPAAACKEVTVTAGTFLVCAVAATLGGDCDPAVGRYCSGAVCVDGYCR